MLQSNHLIGFGVGVQGVTLTTVTINTADGTAAGQTYTLVDRATAVLNGVTVPYIGFYSTTARTVKVKIVKRNSANNYDVVVDQSYSHGGTGWEDVTLSSSYVVPGSGAYFLAGYVGAGGANPNTHNAAAARAYAGPGNDLSGTGVATTGEDSAGGTYPMRYSYN